MKQLKVLQLIDSLKVGGAEMMAVNIANGLSEVGVESYLCTTRKEGILKNKLNAEVGFLFLNKKSKLDFKSLLKLKRYIKQNNIEIIHAHSSSFFLATLIKFLIPSLKICWHDHYGFSDDLKNRPYFILKQFSRFFCHIIVVNHNLEKWAIKHLKNSQISLFPNFAVLSFDKTTFLKGEVGKRIVCIANLRPQKDHLNLLNTFQIFQKDHQGWTLHLIGKDNHNEYSKNIHKLIDDYKLINCVFIYGSKTDINHILSQASIGVLSSKSEGLPVSLLEYGLTKLPVVCTDVGDCSAVIKHQYSGFIVPPQNPIEFAFYLSKLAASKEVQINFGQNLYNYIQDHYSKESAIKAVIKIYQRCLQT